MESEKLPKMAPSNESGNGRLEELAKAHGEKAAEIQSGAVGSGRGVKPGTVRGSYNKGKRQDAQSPQVAGPDLFPPSVLGPVLRLPYIVSAAYFKSDAFLLTKSEEQVLADSASATCNAWFPTVDPKWAALTAFSMALTVITGQKMLIFMEERRALREALKKKEPEIVSSAPSGT